MAGLSRGEEFDAVFPICELGLPGLTGVVVGSALGPEQMLSDQGQALLRMERAVGIAQAWAHARDREITAVGLGSLCAVVAGRGTALAERVAPPVTTGGAATARTSQAPSAPRPSAARRSAAAARAATPAGPRKREEEGRR